MSNLLHLDMVALSKDFSHAQFTQDSLVHAGRIHGSFNGLAGLHGPKSRMITGENGRYLYDACLSPSLDQEEKEEDDCKLLLKKYKDILPGNHYERPDHALMAAAIDIYLQPKSDDWEFSALIFRKTPGGYNYTKTVTSSGNKMHTNRLRTKVDPLSDPRANQLWNQERGVEFIHNHNLAGNSNNFSKGVDNDEGWAYGNNVPFSLLNPNLNLLRYDPGKQPNFHSPLKKILGLNIEDVDGFPSPEELTKLKNCLSK